MDTLSAFTLHASRFTLFAVILFTFTSCEKEVSQITTNVSTQVSDNNLRQMAVSESKDSKIEFDKENKVWLFENFNDALSAKKDGKKISDYLQLNGLSDDSKQGKYFSLFQNITENDENKIKIIFKKNPWIIVDKYKNVGFKDSTLFDSFWDERHLLFTKNGMIYYFDGTYFEINSRNQEILKEINDNKNTKNKLVKRINIKTKTVNTKTKNSRIMGCYLLFGKKSNTTNTRKVEVTTQSYITTPSTDFLRYDIVLTGTAYRTVVGLWFAFRPSNALTLYSRYYYDFYNNNNLVSNGQRNQTVVSNYIPFWSGHDPVVDIASYNVYVGQGANSSNANYSLSQNNGYLSHSIFPTGNCFFTCI